MQIRVPVVFGGRYRVCLRAKAPRVIFGGDSAGGGLALSLLCALRDEEDPELPLPRGAVLMSPWTDLREGLSDGDTPPNASRDANQRWDFLPKDLVEIFAGFATQGSDQYAQQANPAHLPHGERGA